MPKTLAVRFRVWLGLVLALGAWLRLQSLDLPSAPYFDETYYLDSARDWLAGRPDSNPYHPPLGRLLFAVALAVRDHVASARFLSALAGCLTLAAVAWWGRALSRETALAATLMLALEPLHVVHSRLATLDALLTFFVTLAAALAWRGKRGVGPALGLAAACKWSALLAWLGLGGRRRWLAWVVALQLAVHVVALGISGEAWGRAAHGYADEVAFRRSATHLYGSPAWSWPLLLRPVWYRFEATATEVHGVVGLGSPVLFGAFLLLGLNELRRNRRLAALYLAGWLPWLLVRQGFLYYMLPLLPVMSLAVGTAMAEQWRAGGARRGLAVMLGAGQALCLATLWPFLTDQNVSPSLFHSVFFWRGWI